MSTFMTFAAGFVMRPVGALVLGPYIDRIGRRRGLIVTLAIMAMGTGARLLTDERQRARDLPRSRGWRLRRPGGLP